MDLEAPLDAWYVWFGVVVVTVTIAGVALSFPSEAPPDANAAANTIEDVSTSSFNASASYDHAADEVRINTEQIELRNDGGTDRATLAFGSMIPVREHPDDVSPGENIVMGVDPREEFDDKKENMMKWKDEVLDNLYDEVNDGGSEWREASDVLRVKRVEWGEEDVTFVYI